MISPELLRRYHCFATISAETLKAVAMIAEEVAVAAGTQLHTEGEPADILSIIVDGTVDIEYTLPTGQGKIFVRLSVGPN